MNHDFANTVRILNKAKFKFSIRFDFAWTRTIMDRGATKVLTSVAQRAT